MQRRGGCITKHGNKVNMPPFTCNKNKIISSIGLSPPMVKTNMVIFHYVYSICLYHYRFRSPLPYFGPIGGDGANISKHYAATVLVLLIVQRIVILRVLLIVFFGRYALFCFALFSLFCFY